MTTEKDIIARLRRFATDPAARGLNDDAALLDGLVITHDTIAEGVHFRSSDPPASVGWKLVAVNLSDLAAKGASPRAAVLSLAMSDPEWDEAFLSGVEAACECYGLALIGGDTVALPEGAPRVLGMTAIGAAGDKVPARSGGRPGEILWLVGTLGDSAAGLALLEDDGEAGGPLVDHYRRPVPLLAAGQALAPLASAMMDISDGLLIDLQRLCVASGCGAEVRIDAIPLSQEFVAERGEGLAERLFAATGGDDYALLLSLSETVDPLRLCLPSETTITAIGRLVEGRLLALFDGKTPVPLPETLGFEHHLPQ